MGEYGRIGGRAVERPGSGLRLLTEPQREKLLDDDNLAERDRRQIRNRVEATMIDFILLNRNLSQRDRLQVFYEEAVDWHNRNDEAVLNKLAVKLSEGREGYDEDMALAFVHTLDFVESVALYPNQIGVGEIAHQFPAQPERWAQAIEEAQNVSEQSEEEQMREAANMIMSIIGQGTRADIPVEESVNEFVQIMAAPENRGDSDT
ncbi:MAG: hypothetical protein ABEI86_04790 [Halobacteriaceae archaeon]